MMFKTKINITWLFIIAMNFFMIGCTQGGKTIIDEGSLETPIDEAGLEIVDEGDLPAERRLVSGDIVVRDMIEDIELPSGAKVIVKLEDVSIADAPSIVLSERIYEDATTLPLTYELDVDLIQIDEANTYSVSAQVDDAAGNLLYINDTMHPVLTNETAQTTDVELIAVEGAIIDEMVGIYKAILSAASSPGQDVTLFLNADQSVEWKTDYLQEDGLIVEVGSWQKSDDGTVRLTMTGQLDQEYESPEVIVFTFSDGILSVVDENHKLFGQSGLKLYRMKELATNQISMPFHVEAANEIIERDGLAGYYKNFLVAASSVGQDVTLLLKPDNSSFWSTDYLAGDPPIVEIGQWKENEDGTVTLTITGQLERVYNSPVTVRFALSDGILTAVEYDKSRFGEVGVQFYRFFGFAIGAAAEANTSE